MGIKSIPQASFHSMSCQYFWVTDGQNKTNLFSPWRKQGRWGGQDKHLTSWLRNGNICWRVAPRSCDLKRQTNKINKTKQNFKQNSKCPNSVSESIVEKKGEMTSWRSAWSWHPDAHFFSSSAFTSSFWPSDVLASSLFSFTESSSNLSATLSAPSLSPAATRNTV